MELGPADEDAYTSNMSAEFWNERYSADDLVYGDAPNEFLASVPEATRMKPLLAIALVLLSLTPLPSTTRRSLVSAPGFASARLFAIRL